MMNFKKRKTKTTLGKGIVKASLCLCVAIPLFSTQRIYAASDTAPMIAIDKPDGWKQGSTTVAISVDTSRMGSGFRIAKMEAKVGKNGTWQDVTKTRSITINGNQTVYVRVTDTEGNIYEQNRSIRCYDTEKPTLSASLTDGILTIQGNDSVSGIASVTVNGTTYTDLTDGRLKVQLTQKDFTTKQFEITVTDAAGNTSERYVLQNPYYEWAVQQAQQQSVSNDTLSTETASYTGDGTSGTAVSPLPQDAEASQPTEAKGTVDERTVTGIEEELAQSGEAAQSITQTAASGTKEFYTISTKSGKLFYLVIDNSKSQDNVYFLTEVSEKDLMNFTLSDTVTLPDVGTVYAEPETEVAEPEEGSGNTEEPGTSGEEDGGTEEVKMPEDQSSAGSYLIIGLVAAGALCAGYYFKIYKPKHEYDGEEYEDEYEEEEGSGERKESDDDEDADFEEDVLEDEEE